MTLRPVASLGVKLLGLFTLLNALPYLGVAQSAYAASSGPPNIVGVNPLTMTLLSLLPGGVQMIVGIGMWAFSDGIAGSMTKTEGDAPLQAPPAWAELVFSAVGLWMLVQASAELARYWASVEMIRRSGLSVAGTPYDPLSRDLVPAVVRGALGLGLLLGARGVVRGVASLENVGRDAA